MTAAKMQDAMVGTLRSMDWVRTAEQVMSAEVTRTAADDSSLLKITQALTQARLGSRDQDRRPGVATSWCITFPGRQTVDLHILKSEL
jgi:hypothetical protein